MIWASRCASPPAGASLASGYPLHHLRPFGASVVPLLSLSLPRASLAGIAASRRAINKNIALKLKKMRIKNVKFVLPPPPYE